MSATKLSNEVYMPNYSYQCAECQHEEVKFRKMDARNDPLPCPECGGNCTLTVTVVNIQRFGNQKGMSDWERIYNRPK